MAPRLRPACQLLPPETAHQRNATPALARQQSQGPADYAGSTFPRGTSSFGIWTSVKRHTAPAQSASGATKSSSSRPPVENVASTCVQKKIDYLYAGKTCQTLHILESCATLYISEKIHPSANAHLEHWEVLEQYLAVCRMVKEVERHPTRSYSPVHPRH